MNPSAFELSKGISDTIGRSRRRQRDLGAIDEILTEALKSGDPSAAMAQILSQVSPERQPAALKFLQGQIEQLQQEKKQTGAQKLARTKLEEQREFNKGQLKEQRKFNKGKLEEQRKFDKSKPALTPNEELNQVRSDAKDARESALAPFKNAFGGLELASKEKRLELAGELKEIRHQLQGRITEISNRLGIESFGPLQQQETTEIVEEISELDKDIAEVEGKQVLTEERAKEFFDQATKEGHRGAARKKRAIELAKQRGY